MRILITTDWYKPVINGVVTSVVNLEQHLREQGHEVRVLTLSQSVHSWKDGEVYYIKSISVNKIYPNARMVYSNISRYLSEIMDWKPEIIHSQCEFSSYMFAKRIAAKLDIPIVHTYHTVYEDYTHYITPSKAWGRNVAQLISRRVCNNVNHVIVPTQKVRILLEQYGVTAPIDVIPSGIDLGRFERGYEQSDVARVKQSLGIPKSDQVVVMVGRMAKEKNQQEVIEYFGKAAFANVSLLCVGGGPYEEQLKELAAGQPNADKIFFSGMVKPQEVGLYYHVGDVFVCSSQSETQGITYIEALACGLPSVCRKDPCLEGVVIDNVNGFLYETYEQFQEKLQMLLYDSKQRRAMARRAVQSVEKYSAKQFAKNVEQVYLKTLNKHKEEASFPLVQKQIMWYNARK